MVLLLSLLAVLVAVLDLPVAVAQQYRYCTPTPRTDGYELTWVKSRLGLIFPNYADIGVIGFKGHIHDLDYYLTIGISPRLPVLESLIGQVDGKNIIQSSEYRNVTLGIQDRNVFVPPVDCKDANLQGVEYKIEGSSCEKIKLNTTFRQACTPADSVWNLDVTWYGWQGRMFIYEFRGTQGELVYHISMTQVNHPVLFMEDIRGPVDGGYIFKSSLFSNMTYGIADASVFNPPSLCDNIDYTLETDGLWMRSAPGIVSF